MGRHLTFLPDIWYSTVTMLVDEVTITVKAGKGGAGLAHFRREKFVPRGGPDGGDGGDGGDVWVTVDRAQHGLQSFARGVTVFSAENGEQGRAKKQHGADGADLELVVPPGTVIWEGKEHEGEVWWKQIADLTLPGEKFLLAKAGRGGRGNCHFATSTHQAPLEFEPGTPGQVKLVKLELKLLADVGLIGLPNAGKSSLLTRITAAEPKIGDYPFTTLEPNLGVLAPEKIGIKPDQITPMVFADIPGLIEGAHLGKGLGDQFLRHTDRTKILVHLIEATHPDPLAAYTEIRAELAAWSPDLAAKPELVAISKVDLLDEAAQRQLYAETKHLHPTFISAATGRGVQDLVKDIARLMVTTDSVEHA